MREGTQTTVANSSVTVVPTSGGGFAEEQRRILEGIATGVPMRETLTRIVRAVEAEAPTLRASVLLLEGEKLRHGAAPSLPEAYNAAIDGLEIGPGVGSCGTAAFTRVSCVVEDIETHPYWERFRALAAEHGLRACWSTPIPGRSGEVLGTFALYHGEPRGPTQQESSLVQEATHLASVAIQHDRLLRVEAARLAELTKRMQLREFLQRAPMPVALLTGSELVYDFANSAYETLVNRRDLVRKRVVEAFPEVESQGVIDLLRGVYESGQPYENPEMRVELDRGRGREEGWFSVRIDPYTGDDGTRGLLVIGFDITQQVKGRVELDGRRAELATREKTSALGQLVSGVAHEIRTPLTYLATNLNIIQLRLERLVRSLPPEQRESCNMLVDQYIPSALEGVDRISHIVEDLREFTQLRHGVREPANLHEVVAQAVGLFQATNRGRVHVRLEPGVDATLVVDKLQIQQALLNLMQNAMEARPRDHTIVVRTLPEENGVVVEVVDTGGGIPPEVQGRLFDPFYTTKEGGTGLGLSIVKRVVEDHGGRVSFTTSGAGTAFRLALPTPDR